METTSLQGRTFQLTAPSGFSYEVREQNGEDDDIISNPSDAKDLTNIARFIQGIVVKTDRYNRKPTLEEVISWPVNDRYAILVSSRKFSLGESVDFTYDWGKENGGKKEYEQELDDFLFDYASEPTEEELDSKPYAIPFYPLQGIEVDIDITLSSGKVLKFDLLTGKGESYLLNLPMESKTKNQELIARNLRLLIGDKYEAVTNFRLFTSRDMVEIRKEVAKVDPVFTGTMEVENPSHNMKVYSNIIGLPGFFFPGEI